MSAARIRKNKMVNELITEPDIFVYLNYGSSSDIPDTVLEINI